MSTVASSTIFNVRGPANQPDRLHPGMALGAVALALFGAIWLAAGASAAYPAAWPALVGIAAGAIALVTWSLTTFRRHRRTDASPPDAATKKRMRRGFMLINAVQWMLIGTVIPVLHAVGHADSIRAAIILVVGVHFVPLARLLDYPGYYWTTLGLLLVAGCDLFVSGHPGLVLGAAGVVLWVSAVRVLWVMRGDPARGAAGGTSGDVMSL